MSGTLPCFLIKGYHLSTSPQPHPHYTHSSKCVKGYCTDRGSGMSLENKEQKVSFLAHKQIKDNIEAVAKLPKEQYTDV